MAAGSDAFYQELESFAGFRQAANAKHYRDLPDDWLVVITDVRGSTAAIQAGRYKDINALGVASIVAVLNALKPLQVPYVFGGDGATFCVPASRRAAVEAALVATRDLAEQAFGLGLRVGLVDMERILADGHRVAVAKLAVSPHYHQAMLSGDGLAHAESLVKDPALDNPFLVSASGVTPAADFTGFECRWKEIPSPHEETVSLIIQAVGADDAQRVATYAAAMDQVEAIYGDESCCHPLREELLELSSVPSDLQTETRIRSAGRSGLWRRLYATRLPLLTAIGRCLMRHARSFQGVDWTRYKRVLIANTDYRKFDAVLRMVIAGSAEQRSRLRAALEDLRSEGRLVYGIHVAQASLMTCVISDYSDQHVHFLDAAGGGYALAAKELKAQLLGARRES